MSGGDLRSLVKKQVFMGRSIKRSIHKSVRGFEYLDDFIKALKNVGHEYYAHKYQEHNKTRKVLTYMERVFAYEFYHQYRKIMERKPEIYSEEGELLYLGGEQTKTESGKCSPDLVLHGSFNSCDKQEWVCEIKTCQNAQKFEDIPKLLNLSSKFAFKNSIFLYIGSPKDKTKTLIESFKEELNKKVKRKDSEHIEIIKHKRDGTESFISRRAPEEKLNNIICILSNRTEDSLEIHAMRLRDILD